MALDWLLTIACTAHQDSGERVDFLTIVDYNANVSTLQEPDPNRDPECEQANGVFNHPDENECEKYIQCDKGSAFVFPCPSPLVFDVVKGACLRKANLDPEARRCDGEKVFEVDGFTCPSGKATGPNGLLQVFISCSHYQKLCQ